MTTNPQSIRISDPTLRDGNHAVKHALSVRQIEAYAAAADRSGVSVVEVGHGNGLGASSLQVGESAVSDREMLAAARSQLHRAKLGVHAIPGFATIQKDIAPALEAGVDVVRVGCHCTEADTTQRHLGYVRDRGREAAGVLMMSHMAPVDLLVEEACKMEKYGAQAVVIMDSSGAYLPGEVSRRIGALSQALTVSVGFHAHNNLGMAIANSIAAVEAGARIVDATARGFGAGAGNAQLEVLVAVLEKLGYSTGVDLYKILDAADLAAHNLMKTPPSITSISIVSGLAGVFSGFAKPVEAAAAARGVDARDIMFELGRRESVAGQEDMILEIAAELALQGQRSQLLPS